MFNNILTDIRADLIKDGLRLGLTPKESEQFAVWFMPKIEPIEVSSESVTIHVTQTPFATLAATYMGADTNYRFHTGRRAITQSSVLFSICCVVVCRFSGGLLRGVAPDVTFERPLKVGDYAVIYAAKEDWGDEVRTTLLRGETPDGAILFTDRIITTRTPRDER